MKKIEKQNGFTLVEVLIALIILSIGLLGLAGMQVNGMRQNQNSMLRTQATFLAYDIADRMRANRQVAVETQAYDIAIGDPGGGGGLEAQDLIEWKANLAASLPSGEGSIVTNGVLTTITVTWDDSQGDTAGQEPLKVFTLSTQL